MKTKRKGLVYLLDRDFYFFMTLLVAAIVVYGFSHTVGPDYLHASPIPPFLLTIHVLVFCGWIIFFILQSTLVRIHKVSVHRTLGWVGVALGIGVIALGYSTAIVMDRFFIAQFHNTTTPPLLLVQFSTITYFAIFFTLAVFYRRRPEYHRRLMVIATCTLMFAAFTRFPHLPRIGASGCVDVLILLGVVRDLIVDRRVHKVYVYSLAFIFCCQFLEREIRVHAMHWWTHVAYSMLR